MSKRLPAKRKNHLPEQRSPADRLMTTRELIKPGNDRPEFRRLIVSNPVFPVFRAKEHDPL